jgi:hypothetical protein
MAFLVSPGVQSKEIDASNSVPGVSMSTGAIAGSFNWGPANDIVTVGSEAELVAAFGSPDLTTSSTFLSAANFLMYGRTLRVVRSSRTGALNATGAGTAILVENDAAYEANPTMPTGAGFIAKHPGALGNAIEVSLCPADTSGTVFGQWTVNGKDYKDSFNFAPKTSSFANTRGISLDEMHAIVVDKTGAITGSAGSILETFPHVSQLSDAKGSSGESTYYKNVINNSSRWVRWARHSTDLTQAGSLSSAVTGAMDSHADSIESTLTGGVDGSVSTDGQNLIAYRKFENSAETEVDFIIGQAVSAVQGIALSGIADLRKDCVVCLSPPIEASLNTDPTDAVLTWGNTINPSTYAILDSTALKVYDKYNDVFVNIGASAAVAGCMAATDDVADPWFSPAGVSRGQIRGVTKLLWNPSQANRDMLYKAGINPIVSMPGQGTMLFGDKTHAGAPSSFDRINVRRLFITLQKAINLAARAQLFEFNDEFTRAQFKNMIEPFLRDVKGRRGVTDFKVVCDGTNNTGTIVDTNQFIADIYVKPSRSINFITLNFIVTRTGVAFSEIAG